MTASFGPEDIGKIIDWDASLVACENGALIYEGVLPGLSFAKGFEDDHVTNALLLKSGITCDQFDQLKARGAGHFSLRLARQAPFRLYLANPSDPKSAGALYQHIEAVMQVGSRSMSIEFVNQQLAPEISPNQSPKQTQDELNVRQCFAYPASCQIPGFFNHAFVGF
jgi:hypothetical protein